MTRVEITDGRLNIEVLGWDRIWSMKNQLSFPLENIEEAHRWNRKQDQLGWGVIRAPGTSLPGVIVAGTYHHKERGRWRHLFYDVHRFSRAIVIKLRDEWFSRVIIEVENPDAVLNQITDRAAPSGNAMHA